MHRIANSLRDMVIEVLNIRIEIQSVDEVRWRHGKNWRASNHHRMLHIAKRKHDDL